MPDPTDAAVTEASLAQPPGNTADAAQRELLDMVPALEVIAMRALGTGPDVNDAVQEVVQRTLAALEQGRLAAGAPLAPFVYGIARHVIADVLRGRRADAGTSGDVDDLHAPVANALDALVRDEDIAALQRALAGLPAADVELLRRCFVDGESIATISRSTGEPAARLRKRKSRAVERLRHSLRRSPNADI